MYEIGESNVLEFIELIFFHSAARSSYRFTRLVAIGLSYMLRVVYVEIKKTSWVNLLVIIWKAELFSGPFDN